MSPLVYRCPVTNMHMISGILLAQDAHDAMKQNPIGIDCPLCGQIHMVNIRGHAERLPLQPLPIESRTRGSRYDG
jgi:hypothetical protein